MNVEHISLHKAKTLSLTLLETGDAAVFHHERNQFFPFENVCFSHRGLPVQTHRLGWVWFILSALIHTRNESDQNKIEAFDFSFIIYEETENILLRK